MDETALTLQLADQVRAATRLEDLSYLGLPAEARCAFAEDDHSRIEACVVALLVSAALKEDLHEETQIPCEAAEQAATQLTFVLRLEAGLRELQGAGLVDVAVPEHLLGRALAMWATEHWIDTEKLPEVQVHHVDRLPLSLVFSPRPVDGCAPKG